jgi:hypothetical protein
MAGPMSKQVKSIQALAAQSPQPTTLWHKAVTATPVILTVLATILAGLSSGELTRALIFRGLAAQNQAKAGDQWTFYQFKRIHAAESRNAVAVLAATSEAGHLDVTELAAAPGRLAQVIGHAQQQLQAPDAPAGPSWSQLSATLGQEAAAAAALDGKIRAALADRALAGLLSTSDWKVPDVPLKTIGNDNVRAALAAIASHEDEAQLDALALHLGDGAIVQAMADADDNVRVVDEAGGPADNALTRLAELIGRELNIVRILERQAGRLAALPDVPGHIPADLHAQLLAIRQDLDALNADFTVARLGYAADRYEKQAACNMAVAQIYELQVHQSSATSDRHRERSKWFFDGMLVAQAGVTIATLSLAATRRNILWALASAAGLIALGLSAWVYMFF